MTRGLEESSISHRSQGLLFNDPGNIITMSHKNYFCYVVADHDIRQAMFVIALFHRGRVHRKNRAKSTIAYILHHSVSGLIGATALTIHKGVLSIVWRGAKVMTWCALHHSWCETTLETRLSEQNSVPTFWETDQVPSERHRLWIDG